MVKVLFCLRRRPDLSVDEFQRYWRGHHAGLVAANAGDLRMRRYVQAHTLSGPVAEALRGSRGAPPAFDGVAELWWDDVRDIEAATSTRSGRAAARSLIEDERRFIDLERSPILIAHEYEIFANG